jgi:nucleoside-diphosphate-sugar epimerase
VQTAIEGTMNVVRQAYDSGVKKFAVISSVGAAIDILDPKPKITEEGSYHSSTSGCLLTWMQ